jgi:predicted dehydrogenase
MRTPVTVGVVGLGPWGSRLARTFEESPHASLRWLCDRRAVGGVRRLYGPQTAFTHDIDDLLADESLDAVVLATPAAGRSLLVRRALNADKHVFAEGPIAQQADQADELVALAAQRNRRLMVGHLLLFHPAVRKLKELVELGRLGELFYVDAIWRTPHRTAEDGSVLAALGASGVAAILYLVGDEPVEAQALAESYVDPGTTEFATCHLRFATGIAASLHVSWLDARGQCRLDAVGSRRTAAFDDGDPVRKLTVFDRDAGRGAEIVSPRLAPDDPLRIECDTFLPGCRSQVEFPRTRIEPSVVRVRERLAAAEPAPVPLAGVRRGMPLLRLAPALQAGEGARLSTKKRPTPSTP